MHELKVIWLKMKLPKGLNWKRSLKLIFFFHCAFNNRHQIYVLTFYIESHDKLDVAATCVAYKENNKEKIRSGWYVNFIFAKSPPTMTSAKFQTKTILLSCPAYHQIRLSVIKNKLYRWQPKQNFFNIFYQNKS